MSLSSVLTGCLRSKVRGGLKFQSGLTWARLILIVAVKKGYLIFLSWSFVFLLASSSLLLNISKAISRRFLWGGGSQGPFHFFIYFY